MDWGSAIIGLIIILICILPIGILYYKRVKKENKMLQSLNEIAQQHNCKIGQYEFCGNYVIGLDEDRNFAFFFKQKKEDAISQFVDLSEVQLCQVVKKIKNIRNDIGSLSYVERLGLSFIPKNSSKRETIFELYDVEINMQLSGELQFAEKWANQLNTRLKNKK
ncbi:MAG: hypothetical protein HPY60_11635 [Candidatus Methanofastidiosum sp.]|nr:hypothetical protein [Methanofastidiosum sp.]